MKRLGTIAFWLLLFVLITGQMICYAEQPVNEFKFVIPREGQQLIVGEPFICEGTYKLSSSKINLSGIHIWLFLMDKYLDGYYLQGPLNLNKEGTWKGTINPGKDIIKVVAVLTNNQADKTFKSWRDKGNFGKQYNLPKGAQVLAEVEIK